ncbi:MAG: DNA polymerase III subunit delta [Eubacteriales bacterium]|nr:DNA polymerase III subunit delta [Eubacteriales bacterium]
MAVKNKNKLTYAAMSKELDAQPLRKIYVLLGQEEFLITYLRNKLYSKALAPGFESMDAVIYDLDNKISNLNRENLLADISTPSFMSPYKLVHIKQSGIFKRALNDEALAEWSEIVERVGEGTILLFEERQEGDDRAVRLDHKLLRLIEEQGGAVVRLDQQTERELLSWISAQMKFHNLNITNEAALSLVSRFDSSMSMIQQALNVIFLYAESKDLESIDLHTVDLLCRPDLSGRIFDLTDALAAGNTDRSLDYLDRLFDRGEAPLGILTMISNLFRRLLIAKELENPSAIIDSGITSSSYYASKLLQQARSFSLEQLEEMVEACFQTDLQIKTGEMQDRSALVVLLIQLSNTKK